MFESLRCDSTPPLLSLNGWQQAVRALLYSSYKILSGPNRTAEVPECLAMSRDFPIE